MRAFHVQVADRIALFKNNNGNTYPVGNIIVYFFISRQVTLPRASRSSCFLPHSLRVLEGRTKTAW